VASKVYNSVQIAFKYAFYFLRAKNCHSVHSPLIFGFCEKVLGKRKEPEHNEVEKERFKFKHSEQNIDFKDYVKDGHTIKKSVSKIAQRSLKSKKYAKLISRSVAYFKSKSILELGTSLGITTAYIAKNKEVQVTSLEGDESVAALAKQTWQNLSLNNIEQRIGNFDNTLIPTLKGKTFDFIYIDGNHKLEPTLHYFELCLAHADAKCILLFDDIHYSKEMEQAWSFIKNHPKVISTIDLFFLGYVFLNYDITPKHYTLKF